MFLQQEPDRNGKENLEGRVTQPKQQAFSKKQYHTVYVPSASVPEADFSLYTDEERGLGHMHVIPPRDNQLGLDLRAVDNDTTLETSSQTSERRQIKRKVLR